MQFPLSTKVGSISIELLNSAGAIGKLFYQTLWCFFTGKFRFRVLIEQIARIGVESQPVVILTGAFTGAVLEAQSLFQLQIVKMEAMGGAIVAVGMFRELGPAITGLMLAGRVGSAMAAEIGTMKVTEQIDALRSMNVNPIDYLVKPRVIGMLVSTPILMIESVIVGIVAAYIVGIFAFDVNEAYWVHFMTQFVTLSDIAVSIIKAFIFGLIIALISCSCGLQTENGAVGVGKSTMRAMVYASVILLIVNFIMTMILNTLFPMGFMQ